MVYWKHKDRPEDLLETLRYAIGFIGNLKVRHKMNWKYYGMAQD